MHADYGHYHFPAAAEIGGHVYQPRQRARSRGDVGWARAVLWHGCPAPAESAPRAQLDQGVPVQHTAASLPVDQAVVRVAEMDMGRPGRFNDEDAVAGAHPALPPSSGGHITMGAKASADAGAVKVRVIEAGEYPPAFRARRRL